MIPCPQCGNLVKARDRCPGCSTSVFRSKTSAALVLGLSLACAGGPMEPMNTIYGAPDSFDVPDAPPPLDDADQDGSNAEADCDDADAKRFPGNTETAGDGVDSNCNGDDDT